MELERMDFNSRSEEKHSTPTRVGNGQLLLGLVDKKSNDVFGATPSLTNRRHHHRRHGTSSLPGGIKRHVLRPRDHYLADSAHLSVVDRRPSESQNFLRIGKRMLMPAITLISPIKTLIRSLRLILTSFTRYLRIYLLTSVPLSLAQTSLSVTLHPYRLLLLRHTYAARPLSISLILSRSLISLPLLLPLSLLSSTSTISSTFSLLSSPISSPPPLLSTIRRFPHVLATSICAHALTWLYLCVPSLILSSLPASAATAVFLIRVVAWAGEARLIAAMAVAVVATVVSPEVEVGWGAVREGWRSVGRRWWCAWSATVALGTEGIWGGVLLRKMDGQDWSGVVGLVRWMAGIGWRAWLVPLYGFLVLLSYVVYTLFYWDYRKACLITVTIIPGMMMIANSNAIAGECFGMRLLPC